MTNQERIRVIQSARITREPLFIKVNSPILLKNSMGIITLQSGTFKVDQLVKNAIIITKNGFSVELPIKSNRISLIY